MDDEVDRDSQRRADERADDVDPHVSQLPGHERRSKRANRVHRSALQRQRDQAAQGDRCSHGERGIGSDDPCSVSRAEDDGDEEEGQHDLEPHSRQRRDVRRGHASLHGRSQEDADHECARDRADQLREPIRGHEPRREEALHREGRGDHRVEMRTRHVADRVDQRGHHHRRRDRSRRSPDSAARDVGRGISSDGNENQRHGADHFGCQASAEGYLHDLGLVGHRSSLWDVRCHRR